MNLLLRFAKNEDGTTSLEYGLIAASLSVLIITGVTSVGTKISIVFLGPVSNAIK